MKFEYVPSARAEMLVRKPGGEVFEAFVDPAITSRSLFTRGSGRLEAGKRILQDPGRMYARPWPGANGDKERKRQR